MYEELHVGKVNAEYLIYHTAAIASGVGAAHVHVLRQIALDVAAVAIHQSRGGSPGRPLMVRQVRVAKAGERSDYVRHNWQRQGLQASVSNHDGFDASPAGDAESTVVSKFGSPTGIGLATSRASGAAKLGSVFRRSRIWQASASRAGRCSERANVGLCCRALRGAQSPQPLHCDRGS